LQIRYDPNRVRFLIHGPIAPAVGAALRQLGHDAEEFGQNDLSADELLEQCHVKQLDIVTADAALARSACEFRGKFDRCIVYVQTTGPDAQGQAIERLFERYRRLSPRRLYTVTESRVKVRQLAGG